MRRFKIRNPFKRVGKKGEDETKQPEVKRWGAR